MADVRPFRGVRYDPARAGDMGRVIAPPYDVLSPAQQHELHDRNPWNVVRLELSESHPGDTPGDNAYTRARDTWREWLAQGILREDPEPAYYILSQRFRIHGRTHERRTVFARVRAEDYAARVVLPHETTLEGPRQDRLTLLETAGANFSPIMLLYRDPGGSIRRASDAVTAHATPEWIMQAPDGCAYTLWMVRDTDTIEAMRGAFAPLTLFIADGHHRYETAVAYRSRRRAEEGAAGTAERPWNFALAGLIDMDDPGLVVLPYHRVLGGIGEDALGRLRERLRALFEVHPVEHDGAWLPPLVAAVETPGVRPRIGVHDPGDAGPALLMERDIRELAEVGPIGTCEPWILQERVLRPVLGDGMKQHITYVHDARDAAAIMARGDAQLSFILRALPLDLFTAIARAGQVLPPKATYFFPKLPTGVVIHPVTGPAAG